MLSLGAKAAPKPHIYVANTRSNPVSIIDPETDAVVTTIAVGPFPVSIAVAPNFGPAYVANSGSNSVSVIDVLSNTVATTVVVGLSPVLLLQRGNAGQQAN